MTLAQDLVQRVQSATRARRIALASACGKRTLPIYETYWIGNYEESVGQAVELGWSVSLGASVDQQHISSALTELQNLVAFYREEGIDVLAATTTVILRVLQSLSENEEESRQAVGRALVSTLDTARYAEAMANQVTPVSQRKKAALAEEEAWQDRAIRIVNAEQLPPTREMFDAAGPYPPLWFTDWLERSKR
jgi:hypothetical protein